MKNSGGDYGVTPTEEGAGGVTGARSSTQRVTQDPALDLRVAIWTCTCCYRTIEIPLKLARIISRGEVAYVCSEKGHRIDLERWRR